MVALAGFLQCDWAQLDRGAEQMGLEPTPEDKLKRDVGGIVALALIGVALLEGVTTGVLAAIEHRDLQPGAADYIEFARLYASTFIMSATITAAVSAVELPQLYGRTASWIPPVVILVVGASLTGLPVEPVGGTPAGWALGALATFAQYYGVASTGGLLVGIAGAGIVHVVADYLKDRS